MDGSCRMFGLAWLQFRSWASVLGEVVSRCVLALRIAFLLCSAQSKGLTIRLALLSLSCWMVEFEAVSSKSEDGRHFVVVCLVRLSLPARSAEYGHPVPYVRVWINTDLGGRAGTKSHCYGESVTITTWGRYETH